MKIQNPIQAYTLFTNVLQFERKIVGIKFLHTQEMFDQAKATIRTGPINYCVMVQAAASHNIAYKIQGKTIACPAGAWALGLIPSTTERNSGKLSFDCGLYGDMATAQSAQNSIIHCNHEAYGVMVKPLEQYFTDNEIPDVVLVIANPYTIMRIVQGYSYKKGIRDYRMGGNQGICSELTAAPYIRNDLNISLLCIGTRHASHWHDDEMGAAFPFNLLEIITDGIISTLNAMENNQNKQKIQENLIKLDITDIPIKFNYNYYR